MLEVLFWTFYFSTAFLAFLLLFYVVDGKFKIETILISCILSTTGPAGILLCILFIFFSVDLNGIPLKEKFYEFWKNFKEKLNPNECDE